MRVVHSSAYFSYIRNTAVYHIVCSRSLRLLQQLFTITPTGVSTDQNAFGQSKAVVCRQATAIQIYPLAQSLHMHCVDRDPTLHIDYSWVIRQGPSLYIASYVRPQYLPLQYTQSSPVCKRHMSFNLYCLASSTPETLGCQASV